MSLTWQGSSVIPSMRSSAATTGHCGTAMWLSPLKDYVQLITQKVLDEGLPPLTCLNVNFPKAQSFKGIKVCQQAKGLWEKEWLPRAEAEHVYDMAGEFRDTDPEEQRNDHWALRHGYVAITPVTVDATDYEMIKRMNHWFEA